MGRRVSTLCTASIAARSSRPETVVEGKLSRSPWISWQRQVRRFQARTQAILHRAPKPIDESSQLVFEQEGPRTRLAHCTMNHFDSPISLSDLRRTGSL